MKSLRWLSPLLLLCFAFNIHAETPFTCTALYSFHIKKDETETVFNGHITLFQKNATTGFFYLNGIVSQQGKEYVISRYSHFEMTSLDNSAKIIQFTQLLTTALDNTPEHIWRTSISLGRLNEDIYLEYWSLKDNLMLMKALNTGLLVCAKNT